MEINGYYVSAKKLTSPPASTALVIDNGVTVDGEGRRLDAAASTDLTAGDLSNSAHDVSIGREMELTSVTDDQTIGSCGRQQCEECGTHIEYV